MPKMVPVAMPTSMFSAPSNGSTTVMYGLFHASSIRTGFSPSVVCTPSFPVNRNELFKMLVAVSYKESWSDVVLLPIKSLTPWRLTALAMALHAIWIELIVPSKSAWSGFVRVASIMNRDNVMMLWCRFAATIGGLGNEVRLGSGRACILVDSVLNTAADGACRRSVNALRHSSMTSAINMRCIFMVVRVVEFKGFLLLCTACTWP